MAKSILQSEKICFFCNSMSWLEEHHIYGGANRKISERQGFKVYLCHHCHNEPPNGVHFNEKRNRQLKKICQQKYEETHTREDFLRLIGRNYI